MIQTFLTTIRKSIFFAGFFLGLFIIVIGSYYLYETEIKLSERIYPGVYINGYDASYKKKEDIRKYFYWQNQDLENVNMTINYNNEEVATFSALILSLAFDEDKAVEKTFEIGRKTQDISSVFQKIQHILLKKKVSLTQKPAYETKDIEKFLSYLDINYYKAPENARFEVNNGRVTAFKIEENGLRLNTDEAFIEINKLLEMAPYDKTHDYIVKLESIVVPPEVKIAAINNFGVVEKIAVGQSDFSGSSSERIHNIILSASKFHGLLVPKDAILSYNQTVGEISATKGYKPSYIIQNGKTILGDGGGVCNTSTVLFRTALNAGLPIIERHPHSYRVRYYENDSKPGVDATAFAPSVDFKFKNDTPAHILIQTTVDATNNILIFEFYGKKDGRIVTLSPVKIWDVVPPPEPLHQEDPTLKKGLVKQVDFAAVGTKATFHYGVKKGSQVLQDKEFFSNFRPWRAVYLVGTGE